MILSILPALTSVAPVHAATEDLHVGPPCNLTPDAYRQGKGTVDAVPEPPMCVFLHPGVADPYKAGWSQTLDTLWGTQANAHNGDPFPGSTGH